MTQYTPKEKVYLWLDSFPLSLKEKERLLEESGSPNALVKDFSRFRAEVIEWAGEGVYNAMSASLTDGGEYVKKLTEKLEKERIKGIFRGGELYPDPLLSLSDAPLVLYARGNERLLKERLFTVVGSRRTSATVLKLTEKTAEELSEGFTVLTGTADGGDTAAAKGALAGTGKVIAVLSGGFSALPQGNTALLKRIEEKGLLLALHSYDTPVRNFSYEYRNKVLATLGEGTLVVSAGESSGALITARYAFGGGKKVFAFPYAPNDASGTGCNEIIKKGAFLTENSVDIFDRFGINLKKRTLPALTDEERRVAEVLKELTDAHINELSSRVGLPVFKLTALLSALEIKGVVVKLGGNRFALV